MWDSYTYILDGNIHEGLFFPQTNLVHMGLCYTWLKNMLFSTAAALSWYERKTICAWYIYYTIYTIWYILYYIYGIYCQSAKISFVIRSFPCIPALFRQERPDAFAKILFYWKCIKPSCFWQSEGRLWPADRGGRHDDHGPQTRPHVRLHLCPVPIQPPAQVWVKRGSSTHPSSFTFILHPL